MGEARGPGLIPTHAGKTVNTMKPTISVPAHPHSRGENAHDRRDDAREDGSSPLTRGKQVTVRGARGVGGLIPTHAGKTIMEQTADAHGAAHPHSRGENPPAFPGWKRGRGSSPLTRGKRLSGSDDRLDLGLIPTHAGKTRRLGPDPGRPWAHPHSRGENETAEGIEIEARGSSPLTRGKRRARGRVHRQGRLIPTHAGKTSPSTRAGIASRAHPHSRGENARRGGPITSAPGSSPLTRGKPDDARVFGEYNGLIPTHAGKTRRGALHGSASGAHPHSRGENDQRRPSHTRIAGSSPLTRGKPPLSGGS